MKEVYTTWMMKLWNDEPGTLFGFFLVLINNISRESSGKKSGDGHEYDADDGNHTDSHFDDQVSVVINKSAFV